MNRESADITAARRVAQQASHLLTRAASFQQLAPGSQAALLRDLNTIQRVLSDDNAGTADLYAAVQQSYRPNRARAAPLPRPHVLAQGSGDPYALSLATPLDLRRRRGLTDNSEPPPSDETGEMNLNEEVEMGAQPRRAATETLAARAGALSDEIDFPGFVAGLIHGTFDAIVDATIRQMEAFAELVGAVAKSADRFTAENVTPNQVRDWLVQQYPRDLILDIPSGGQPRVLPRTRPEDEEPHSPVWLADYGLEGQELTEELIEETLIPLAQRRVGESRLQTLATMVLLGMNRVVVRDGTIETRVRFRAAGRDKAAIDYATSQDPGSNSNWGNRGSAARGNSSMMISTVGVNVQSETDLKAELFGAVKINFASETLPLERFIDSAQMTLLQRHSRPSGVEAAPAAVPPSQPTSPVNTSLPKPPEDR